MADTDITGHCLCGAVSFRATAAPIGARICWCRDCQHLAGGGHTVNMIFPSAAVTIDGAITDYVSAADSGNVMHRRFCPKCGSAMFSGSEARPDLIIVRAGSLDDTDVAQPSAVIWTESAPHWACHNPDLKQFPAQPPPIT